MCLNVSSLPGNTPSEAVEPARMGPRAGRIGPLKEQTVRFCSSSHFLSPFCFLFCQLRNLSPVLQLSWRHPPQGFPCHDDLSPLKPLPRSNPSSLKLLLVGCSVTAVRNVTNTELHQGNRRERQARTHLQLCKSPSHTALKFPVHN